MASAPVALGISRTPGGGAPHRQIKTNLLVIDGRNLYNSKVLEHHPPPRVEANVDRPQNSFPSTEEDLDTWSERNSRYLREILTFLFRSDSRYYAEIHGVHAEDYRRQLHLYEVSSRVGLLLTARLRASRPKQLPDMHCLSRELLPKHACWPACLTYEAPVWRDTDSGKYALHAHDNTLLLKFAL